MKMMGLMIRQCHIEHYIARVPAQLERHCYVVLSLQNLLVFLAAISQNST